MYNKIRHIDFGLLLLAVILSGMGILLVFSIVYNQQYTNVTAGVSSTMWLVKVIAAFIGGGCGIFLAIRGKDFLLKYRYILYAVSIVLMLLTFTSLGIGPSGSDDKAWLSIFGRTIQPSEILKLAFIVSFSVHLSKVKDKINKPQVLAVLLLHALIPIGLCWLQGDQGTSVVFILIMGIMLIGAGLHWGYIVGALGLSPIVILVLWNFILQQHQKDRVLVLFNPQYDPYGAGYQQIQGLKALTSGGLFGKGLFSGGAEDFVYVSEAQNDFIFSYIGQVWGYVGCAIILILLALVCVRLLINARKVTGTHRYINYGIFALILVHTILNIGMVFGILPVIGVPLPFISAGGTAMVVMLTSIGTGSSFSS